MSIPPSLSPFFLSSAEEFTAPSMQPPAEGKGNPGDEFRKRLDEVNRELFSIVDGSAAYNKQLATEFRGLRGGGAAVPITPIITTSSDVVRKEVHNVVAAEMSCLREQMKEYVEREWERHAAEMDAVLRTRFAELRSVHEGFSKVLMEMGNSINKLRADTTAAVEGIAQSASAEIAEVQRTLKLHIVESERDIRVWREAIQELQSETKANIRAHTHRLDEALRGFVVSRQDSLQDTESAIKRAVEKIESKVAAVSTRHEAQSTAAEQAIASLRAQSHVVEDTMRQMYSQLHHVTDEQQAQRSEIRRLHSDLSQVDAAMRGRGTALHLSREPAYRAEPQNDGVQQELFALKQSVAYLGAMVDKKHPHSSNDDAVLPLHQDPAGRIGKHSKHNHNRYGALQHSTSAQEQEQAEEDRDDVVVDRARNEDDATGFPGDGREAEDGLDEKAEGLENAEEAVVNSQLARSSID